MKKFFLFIVFFVLVALGTYLYLYMDKLNLKTEETNKNEYYIESVGTCVEEIDPNIFSLKISINATNYKSGASITTIKEQYSNLTSQLQQNNLQNYDINVDNIITNKIDNKSTSKNKTTTITSYQSTLFAKIVVSNKDDVSKIINLLSKENNISLSHMDSYVSDDLVNNAKRNCLIKSIENAKEKASTIATAIGKNIGEIKSIKELDNIDTNLPKTIDNYNKVSIKELDNIDTNLPFEEKQSNAININKAMLVNNSLLEKQKISLSTRVMFQIN